MAYKPEHDPTNPESSPLYNDSVLKFWNWFDTVWSCNDWMTWHKTLKKKYGKVIADDTFLAFWNDLATGSKAIDCRSLNSSFRDYMKSENLLDALFDGVGIIAKPLGVGTDVVTSVGNGISNIADGAEAATKVLKVVVPVLLIGALAVAGFWAYRHVIKK